MSLTFPPGCGQMFVHFFVQVAIGDAARGIASAHDEIDPLIHPDGVDQVPKFSNMRVDDYPGNGRNYYFSWL